jgi:hypothetical protein
MASLESTSSEHYVSAPDVVDHEQQILALFSPVFCAPGQVALHVVPIFTALSGYSPNISVTCSTLVRDRTSYKASAPSMRGIA